jgi:hypothetical protein
VNPFTDSLLKQLHDEELTAFVRQWDALEALVVRVYKGGAASAQDEAEHATLRPWLLQHTPQWQGRLNPYWPQTRSAGAPTREDPFATLLAAAHARDFVQNWAAMQTLPAARESLNRLLLDVINPLTR